MKIRFVQHAAAALACLGLLLPQGAFAAPAAGAMKSDVALRAGGLLVGQVVDAHGKALADAEVSVLLGEDEVVRTLTDKNGVFAAKGLRGGEYQIVAGGGQVAYRLWAEQTAPPAASNGVLIVTGSEIINGQCQTCPPAGCPPQHGGIVGWVKSHPMLVAAGIAAAIAIPVAVADDDDPTS